MQKLLGAVPSEEENRQTLLLAHCAAGSGGCTAWLRGQPGRPIKACRCLQARNLAQQANTKCLSSGLQCSCPSSSAPNSEPAMLSAWVV